MAGKHAASEAAKSLVTELFKKSPTLASAGAGAYGAGRGDEVGNLIEFVAAQVDVAADLVETAGSGKVSKSALVMALAKKGLSLHEMADNDLVQCGGALAGLGMSTAATVAAGVTTGVGALVAGATLLSDVYAVYAECRAPAAELKVQLDKQATSWYAKFEQGFYEFMGSMGVQFPNY